MNRIYGYLRASTKEQDAGRARQALESFVRNAEQNNQWLVHRK